MTGNGALSIDVIKKSLTDAMKLRCQCVPQPSSAPRLVTTDECSAHSTSGILYTEALCRSVENVSPDMCGLPRRCATCWSNWELSLKSASQHSMSLTLQNCIVESVYCGTQTHHIQKCLIYGVTFRPWRLIGLFSFSGPESCLLMSRIPAASSDSQSKMVPVNGMFKTSRK